MVENILTIKDKWSIIVLTCKRNYLRTFDRISLNGFANHIRIQKEIVGVQKYEY